MGYGCVLFYRWDPASIARSSLEVLRCHGQQICQQLNVWVDLLHATLNVSSRQFLPI